MAVPRAMQEVVAADHFYQAPYWPSAVGLEAGPPLAHVEGAHTAGPLTSGPDLVHGSHRPPPTARCWLLAAGNCCRLGTILEFAAHLTGRCFVFHKHVEEQTKSLLRSWLWAFERLHKLLPQKRSYA